MRMPPARASCVRVAVAVVAVSVAGSWVPGQPGGRLHAASGVQPPPAAPEAVRSLVDRYCVACHNERRIGASGEPASVLDAQIRAAGLALDTADAEHPQRDAERWERVIARLRAGSMPPAGRPRPRREEARAVHVYASFTERRRASLWTGTLGSVAGAGALAALAGVVAPPAWSYAGVVASTLASAAALGGALAAMTWGHWYLTNSGLPKRPLEEMSLLLLAALAVQIVLVAVALAAPVRAVPFTDSAFGVDLEANPALWLRVAVGLIFPALLSWFAWRAATIRGMMSATGLLYIALGAVLAGAVLARGLLFSTGAAV